MPQPDRRSWKAFYCLKINQTSKCKTCVGQRKKRFAHGQIQTQGRFHTCPTAAFMLSRIALPFRLLTILVETFDYVPGENWQLRALLVLVRSPPTRGKICCSSQARWRRPLPAASLTWTGKALLQVPSLKQRSAQLTGCQHSQNSTQNLSQNRNIHEGGGKLL